MKIYPPKEGYTAEDIKGGLWALDADVKCTNPDCGKEWALSYVGSQGGPCLHCGWPCY